MVKKWIFQSNSLSHHQFSFQLTAMDSPTVNKQIPTIQVALEKCVLQCQLVLDNLPVQPRSPMVSAFSSYSRMSLQLWLHTVTSINVMGTTLQKIGVGPSLVQEQKSLCCHASMCFTKARVSILRQALQVFSHLEQVYHYYCCTLYDGNYALTKPHLGRPVLTMFLQYC